MSDSRDTAYLAPFGASSIANDLQPAMTASPLLDIDIDLSLHLDELDLDETDDEDEPVLRWKDGRLVDTWRESYPYDDRMPRHDYEIVKRQLQIELLKLQNWVKDTGQRLRS